MKVNTNKYYELKFGTIILQFYQKGSNSLLLVSRSSSFVFCMFCFGIVDNIDQKLTATPKR